MLGWRIARVGGDSMAPGLKAGDYVIARKSRSMPVPGDVVLVRHSALGLIVKRVLRLDQTGCCILSGDNALSMSSDMIGSVAPAMIAGVVRWRVAPDGVFRLHNQGGVADSL
ncbi:S24/S26 family peptidase [Pelagibius sp.]|uniref:S24/S26 family peptidase n=1 Tax=Pelagibius sp. TaxID=1931238 RepID=UPI003BB0B407